jgi:hypothetical protein
MGTATYHMLIAFAAVLFIIGIVLLIGKPRAQGPSLTERLLPFRRHSLSEEAEEWLRQRRTDLR